MPWRFTGTPDKYVDHAWDLLAAHPVRNTLPLTIAEAAGAGRRWSDEEMLFGWYDEGGRTRGAVSMTPPHDLLLAVVPEDLVDELVTALRERATTLPGVSGETATVGRFHRAWTSGTALRASTAMRMRLYALDHLHPPTVPGLARQATGQDLYVTLAWTRAFQQEAGTPAAEVESLVRGQTEAGRLWLWVDGDGQPVAMAARSPVVVGVSRVGPVYTPPEHRRHGYGAAVTAACTRDALDEGAGHVVLFTDLANPTSNSIYQRIGYRPVGDREIVRFEG